MAIRKVALPAATAAGSSVIALGSGDSPASEYGAITGQHCSSTGGERQCQRKPTYGGGLR